MTSAYFLESPQPSFPSYVEELDVSESLGRKIYLPLFLSLVFDCLHPDGKMRNFTHKNLDNFSIFYNFSIFGLENKASSDHATPK